MKSRKCGVSRARKVLHCLRCLTRLLILIALSLLSTAGLSILQAEVDGNLGVKMGIPREQPHLEGPSRCRHLYLGLKGNEITQVWRLQGMQGLSPALSRCLKPVLFAITQLSESQFWCPKVRCRKLRAGEPALKTG